MKSKSTVGLAGDAGAEARAGLKRWSFPVTRSPQNISSGFPSVLFVVESFASSLGNLRLIWGTFLVLRWRRRLRPLRRWWLVGVVVVVAVVAVAVALGVVVTAAGFCDPTPPPLTPVSRITCISISMPVAQRSSRVSIYSCAPLVFACVAVRFARGYTPRLQSQRGSESEHARAASN